MGEYRAEPFSDYGSVAASVIDQEQVQSGLVDSTDLHRFRFLYNESSMVPCQSSPKTTARLMMSSLPRKI